MSIRYWTTAFVLFAGALIVVATHAVEADDDLPMNMQANAGLTTGGRSRTSMMDISVSQWTTPEERQKLADVLARDGQEALRRALQDMPVKGRVNRRGQMGINWRYAWQHEKSGGRTLVLASDRPIDVNEMIDRSIVARDFTLTLAVIELDDRGRGSGTLFLGAELSIGSDGRLEVTQAGTHGVHLGNVRVR